MFHVLHQQDFRPVLMGLLFIKLVYDTHFGYFNWSCYPTHVNPTGKRHMDKLLGIPNAEELFRQPLPEFTKTLHSLLRCEAWMDNMKPYLFY